MSGKEFWKYFIEERLEAIYGGDGTNGADEASGVSKPLPQEPRPVLIEEQDSKLAKQSSSFRNVLCNGEGYGAFVLLLLIICCGVLRAHALSCREDLLQDVEGIYGRDVCKRPIIQMLLDGRLLSWMAPHSASSAILLDGTILLPMTVCGGITLGYSCFLVQREGWKARTVVLYCLMGVCTGCFAGLVGIGGGLIFSPFILWMSGDPTVAVATSSTCVIFTSSSTTFQYLFTDRITMSLTIIYGIVNLVASYAGTSIVHMLDAMPNKKRGKTLISGIVCLGVVASVILSVYKLMTMGVRAH